MVKHLPAMQENWVRSLGWEEPLEKGIATHSSIVPGDFLGQRSLEGYSPPGSSVHGILQNTGVDSHSLLQGILPTQGSNPVLLHCRQILYSEQPGEPIYIVIVQLLSCV